MCGTVKSLPLQKHKKYRYKGSKNCKGYSALFHVELLNCRRQILCLASSKILTPHLHHRPASVYPRAFGAGGDTLAGWRGGGGSIFWKTPDTCSVLYIRKYFVLLHNSLSKSVTSYFDKTKSYLVIRYCYRYCF
jgi:hypothetical protein